MAIRSHPSGSGSPLSRDDPEPTSDHPASALRTVVVRYEETSDRCTVYPRDCTGEERLVTWISVDLDVVVDLGHLR